MNATPRKVSLALTLLFVFSFAGTLWAQEELSHVRIVRLSFVEGNVTLLRPASVDWATAAVNTPIQEGFQLSTDKNSFAEVEFENGSTARVGELSLLKFDQLALTDSGEEVNRLALDHGYGTFHVSPDKIGTFEVHSADGTFTPQGKAEFRVDLDRGRTRLEVFKGSVDAASNEGNTSVSKDGILEIAPGSEQAFNLTSGIERDDWDSWVADRDEQQTAANVAPPGGTYAGAPAYGWSDLNQYGTWSYFDGYGYGWVPNTWGSWSPFSAGQWSYYPGWGYTWIGYEPWGWLPYHFGGWMNDAMFGWAWFPGESWGFSPGIVDWYQGPGWVGWVPQGPQGPGRRPTGPGLGGGKLPRSTPGCPNGCLNAVNITTFQKGAPITPRQLMNVNSSQAVSVRGPKLQPGLLAQLPGAPAKMSSAQRAVIERGASAESASSFEHVARISPQSSAWSHHAPSNIFASPPSSVRGASIANWGGGSRSRGSGGFAPVPGRGGLSPAPGRSGGFSSAPSRGGGFSSSASRGGGFSSGSHSGGISGGASSAGGGHSGGGASAGGSGGHH